MKLRRVAVMLAITAGLIGCGPKPTTPSGEPGSPSAALDGTWVATKVESVGGPDMPQEELDRMVAMVNGTHVTARRKDDGQAKYLVVEVDATKTPNVVTLIETDEKWDTGPVKRMTFHTASKEGSAPPPAEQLEPRPKARGILTVDGDTAKLALSSEPEVLPTDFTPKSPAKTPMSGKVTEPTPAERAAVVVIHLKRVKETPEWATKPPEQRPVPTTAAVRTKSTEAVPATKPPAPPTSAPKK